MGAPTITTEATGRSEATPEVATVEATASGEAESSGDAMTVARDRAATILESVTAVPPSRITTTDIRIEESAGLVGPDTEASHRATERLRLDCAPEDAETVVTEVADAGGTVRTVQFGPREEAYRRHRDEALTDAMERAREKAECLVSAEGLTVDSVLEITTSNGTDGMQSIADDALLSDTDVHLHPEPVCITEDVEVVYELVEPTDSG